MCCSKEVWCVSQHSFKNMEEIIGDGPLHKERWTGPEMKKQPSRRTGICSMCEEEQEEHCQSPTK